MNVRNIYGPKVSHDAKWDFLVVSITYGKQLSTHTISVLLIQMKLDYNPHYRTTIKNSPYSLSQ